MTHWAVYKSGCPKGKGQCTLRGGSRHLIGIRWPQVASGRKMHVHLRDVASRLHSSLATLYSDHLGMMIYENNTKNTNIKKSSHVCLYRKK